MTDALTEGIAARLGEVRARIAEACGRAGRAREAVRLVAVSKLQPPSAVAAALVAGQVDFGENYAQELRDKARDLAAADPAPRWHFIGPLQRNKVRMIVGQVALIHGVDRVELVREIAARARAAGASQDCLIQVNVGQEAQKSGCDQGELPALLDAFGEIPDGAARCVGLMCIPPVDDDPEGARPHFRLLRGLLEEHRRTQRRNVDLLELSMGMSHDFAIAIAEGATLVRVGTAIFGSRPVADPGRGA